MEKAVFAVIFVSVCLLLLPVPLVIAPLNEENSADSNDSSSDTESDSPYPDSERVRIMIPSGTEITVESGYPRHYYESEIKKLPSDILRVIGEETVRIHYKTKDGSIVIMRVKTKRGEIQDVTSFGTVSEENEKILKKNKKLIVNGEETTYTMEIGVYEGTIEKITNSETPGQELKQAWGKTITLRGLTFKNKVKALAGGIAVKFVADKLVTSEAGGGTVKDTTKHTTLNTYNQTANSCFDGKLFTVTNQTANESYDGSSQTQKKKVVVTSEGFEGADSKTRVCGPDITKPFIDSLNKVKFRLFIIYSLRATDKDWTRSEAINWMRKVAIDTDFWVYPESDSLSETYCPFNCPGTVTLLGRCVNGGFVKGYIPGAGTTGDIITGFMARLLGVRWGDLEMAADLWDIKERGDLNPDAAIAGMLIGWELAEAKGPLISLNEEDLRIIMDGNHYKGRSLFDHVSPSGIRDCTPCRLQAEACNDFAKVPWKTEEPCDKYCRDNKKLYGGCVHKSQCGALDGKSVVGTGTCGDNPDLVCCCFD